MPIHTLSTIHMHRSNSVNAAGMPHREILIAKSRHTPIAAELISINYATALNMPKQNACNNLTRRSPPQLGREPYGSRAQQE